MEREKKIVKASAVGIIMNVFLVVFKGIIGWLSNSIAIIMDAINNFTDVLSATVTIVGTKLAGKAPDKEHPYGHGRAEYLTAVAIACIIFLAGISAIKESVMKIIEPGQTNYSAISLLIIFVAIIVKIFFSKYVKNVGEIANSQSLIATGEDAMMDALLSSGTLMAAVLSYFWKIRLEGFIGVLIGIFIIKTAVEVLREAMDSILGVRTDSELSKNIKERINAFEEVQGTYDLNLHNYGPSRMIGSAHIQVRNDMTAEEIHILTRKIEYAIYEEFGITLTLGIYAANDEGEYGEMKAELDKMIKEYKDVLQIHGFYVDKANQVYFDLIMDFNVKDKMKIRNEMVERLKAKFPNYHYNVILDSDITD